VNNLLPRQVSRRTLRMKSILRSIRIRISGSLAGRCVDMHSINSRMLMDFAGSSRRKRPCFNIRVEYRKSRSPLSRFGIEGDTSGQKSIPGGGEGEGGRDTRLTINDALSRRIKALHVEPSSVSIEKRSSPCEVTVSAIALVSLTRRHCRHYRPSSRHQIVFRHPAMTYVCVYRR